MPDLGLGIGLHVIIAIFFAIHAVRNGKEIFWLMILFFFPLLGSIVYFVAVYLPETRLKDNVRKTVASAAKSLDPGRDLRETKQAYELAPTAQNRMRLADALLNTGDTAQAAELYEACLQGPFAQDPEIRFGVARTRLLNHQAEAALGLLNGLRQQEPLFRVEQIGLLMAKAYAEIGQQDLARKEFTQVLSRSGSLEIQVEYAIWALSQGDQQTAQTLYQDIEKAKKNWNKHTRQINQALMSRLDSAFAAAK